MLLIEWIILLSLCGVTLFSATTLLLIVRGERRRRLLSVRRGVLCDVRGGGGISAVCAGVHDMSQIANLLDTEYPRYEVVVVLDSHFRREEFYALVAAYRMIRVDYRLSGELPAGGVRGLYRSRSRSFRRLVVVDRGITVPAEDLDAAAGVAAYDFLLPVREGQYLLPRAVERLAEEVAEHKGKQFRMIRSLIGSPAVLLWRQEVIAAGGFGGHLPGRIPRRARKTLYEPLFYRPAEGSQTLRWMRVVPACVLAAAIAAAMWHGLWITASVFLTGAFLWAAVVYTAPWVAPRSSWRADCLAAMKYAAQKLTVKNFTIS